MLYFFANLLMKSEHTYRNVGVYWVFLLYASRDRFKNEELYNKYHNKNTADIYEDINKLETKENIDKYFGTNITENIVIENALYNPAIQVPMRGFMNDWIGFKIKNLGIIPVEIQRITSTSDHTTEWVTLGENETMYISKAELGNMALKYGTVFANGRFYPLERRKAELEAIKGKRNMALLYDFLAHHSSFQGGEDHFLTEEARQEYGNRPLLVDTKINMYDVLDEETINKYFRYIPEGKQQAPATNNAEPPKKQSGASQMFGMFKR